MIKNPLKTMVLFLISLICVLNTAYANGDQPQKPLHGNGKIIEQVRPLESFSGINIQNNLNVQLLRSSQKNCSVRADENLLPYIMTEIKNNTLYVYLKNNIILFSDHDITVTLNTANIKQITHSGSGDIDGHGIMTENLQLESHGSGDVRLDGNLNISSINTSGSGDIQLDNVSSEKLTVRIQGEADIEMRGHINLHALYQSGQGDIIIKGIDSDEIKVISQGSGDARLSGKAKSLKMLVNGSADLDASKLETTAALVEVMGSGDIMVNVSEDLNAKVMGSGDITYYGSPKSVSNKVLGSGRIHHHA